MKFLARSLLALTPLMFGACATMGPPQPPSLELPKPPADLRAVRKGDHVTLSWTPSTVTTDRQMIRSLGATRICRGIEAELTECGTPVGEAGAQTNPVVRTTKKKATISYTDLLPAQMPRDGSATYAVEALNADGRGAGLSNQVHISMARTLPPPLDFSAKVTGQGVVLNWTNDLSPSESAGTARYLYRVYRNQEGNQQKILTGELAVGNNGGLTLTDSGIEWEKNYEYRVEIVTEIAQENKPAIQIEGDDSPLIKVFAHDVFPPAVPSGLQAVFSGPGQQAFIDLIWAPVTDVDLDGYNIYRHEGDSVPAKVNLQPLKTPAYRDTSVVSGKTYFYSVTSVDVRGNESARSEEGSESVPSEIRIPH